ncbi:hypothetical protein KSP40_PGU017224 [Platanthera guangdongensis]|uniref:Uncharacterized protein n=1 Tax=Platanthera guangdongensis TaxID=2320717 RepID=A0ABR2M8N4_9ASPA
MAITHDDLSLRNYRAAHIGGRIALVLVALSVLCGLAGFILCLAGEASRSEATWMILTVQNQKGYRCYYSGSGRGPLVFAVVAFLVFAVAMFAEHASMIVAITSPSSPVLVVWPPAIRPGEASPVGTAQARIACMLFLLTWICFAIAELLLMIAVGVESGHLYDWTKPRLRCPKIHPGLFATAGVFGLATVFLGVALYITALRTQRLHQEENTASHQQPQPIAPPQEQLAVRAYQSRASGETSLVNKTTIYV